MSSLNVLLSGTVSIQYHVTRKLGLKRKAKPIGRPEMFRLEFDDPSVG